MKFGEPSQAPNQRVIRAFGYKLTLGWDIPMLWVRWIGLWVGFWGAMLTRWMW
jgi:hypothetical protein